ncbi:MAG: efflux RND transporter periplasmic adaptor subunit [Phycisphaerae bacterium]
MNRRHSFAIIGLSLSALCVVSGCRGGSEAATTESVPQESGSEHPGEVTLNAESRERFGVQVAKVRKQTLTPSFVAPARVTLNTEAMAHVGSFVAGRVSQLAVRMGDHVKKGDLLLTIDSPELGESQNDYLQRRTAVSSGQTAVDIAQSAYERAKKLFDESQGIALTEVQKREGDFKAAQGNLKSAQTALNVAENKLHLLGMDQAAVEALAASGEIRPRYEVHAPIEGQVLERPVTLGELVGPDRDALIVLADLRTLWVIADVPEVQLPGVALGAEARIHLVAAEKQPITGKVSFVDPELDPGTRSARIRIEVTNPDGTLRPGMFAQAEIVGRPSDQAVLALPEDAIQTIDGVPAVFKPVAGESGVFAKQPVEVGAPVGGMVPVISGLREGDEAVVQGSFILKAELGKSAVEED